MAGRPSLRAQLSAQRFVLRRLEYALLGRSMPLRHDLLRAQKLSLLSGCAVATVMLVADTILGSSRPEQIPGDAALVMSRQSGALFVRVDDRLRPVANLTSARLILGSPAIPRLLDESALRDVADGPVLGIPGAPRLLGDIVSPPDVRWAVCDDADGTTTIAAGDDRLPAGVDPHAGIVVTAHHGDGAIYLLYDGKRAMIDPTDPATARALRLDGVAPRTVSATLLNAIPEVPQINPPRVTAIGQAGIVGFPVGAVVRVLRATSPEYYLVLADGLQRVGPLTVDLVRFANAGAEIRDAPAELIAGSPLVDALPVATYPDEPPTLLDTDEELCATWESGRSGIAVGPPAAGARGAVALAASDGDGPGVDAVRVAVGRSLDVADPGSSARYLITDAGVRFPVADSAVAALGMTASPVAAPWAIIGALPAGPELVRESASVAWDVLGSAP